MDSELDNRNNIENKTAVELPGGSLFRDLRAEAGGCDGLEWLLLYEDDPLAFVPTSRLLYVKVIILTPEGRKQAECGQSEILRKCNLRKFETAWFCRALAVAMTEWDQAH